MYIPINQQKAVELGSVMPSDTALVSRLPIRIPDSKTYLYKDDIAILDVISSNINDRPIYFAVTCRPEKMFGLQDFMRFEGLALRIVPSYSASNSAFGSVYGAGNVYK